MSPHTLKPTATDKHLFCFGYGYVAGFLADQLAPHGWKISGTTTDPEKRDFLKGAGVQASLFDGMTPIIDPNTSLYTATHLLISVPPGNNGDPVVSLHALDILEKMPKLEWIGYLSATSVYGNQDGKWIDEKTPVAPASRRGSLRVRAEEDWLSLYRSDNIPLHIFRLAGIYGPGRSALESVRSGLAKRIDKPGHVFNRIHVDDIVQTLIASINAPSPGSIYNLADDVPSTSHEVISFACDLLGLTPPPLVKYDQEELAPIVRSFYKDNKRIRNDKIKSELGVQLLYPDYKSGLQACYDLEGKAFAFLKFGKETAGSSD